LGIILAPTASFARLTKTCLTGTDPSVAADFAQISRVRDLVDAACVCSSFDGSPGKTHGDYVRCASPIIKAQAAVPPGTLRSQCVRTVKRFYTQSTCGRNPNLHARPCIKTRTATGKVSCTIKPTTKSDGFTPSDRCVSGTTVVAAGCDGLTHCIDAADSNADLRIGVGDSGACVVPIGGDRPVSVHVPPSYVPGTPVPLVVMLHGYGVSAAIEESYLRLTPLSDQRGFLYVHPDGTVDPIGNQFWNATEACCNIFASPVNDSTYLSDVIASVSARYSVDPKRVYVMGHSNGGFMAHRMACDHADQIAAIVSLAGAMFADPAECAPASAVSVLEIHGTADGTIAYDGGNILGNPYPSAPVTIGDWVAFDGCTNTPNTSLPPLDLDSSLAGAETTIQQFAAGCMAGSDVELWTIQGGAHIPALSAQFSPDLIDFLLAHPKP
jgi:polyhydroxybutyrate depolymerase